MLDTNFINCNQFKFLHKILTDKIRFKNLSKVNSTVSRSVHTQHKYIHAQPYEKIHFF